MASVHRAWWANVRSAKNNSPHASHFAEDAQPAFDLEQRLRRPESRLERSYRHGDSEARMMVFPTGSTGVNEDCAHHFLPCRCP